MTEFFMDYGLFLAKTLTILLAIAMVVVFLIVTGTRKQTGRKDSLEIKQLNKKYDDKIFRAYK